MIKPFKVTFSPKSRDQIKEVKRWYNGIRPGLGKRLEFEIIEVLEQIKRNPFFEAPQYENVRVASCKKFPYAFHYEIDSTERKVRIALFIHLHQKPFWLPEIDMDEE